jgi:CheY-like chemotaxis protein
MRATPEPGSSWWTTSPRTRLLEAVLAPGYDVIRPATVLPASSCPVREAGPVLLDVVMPQMDGYAVCRLRDARDGRAAGDHAHGECRP